MAEMQILKMEDTKSTMVVRDLIEVWHYGICLIYLTQVARGRSEFRIVSTCDIKEVRLCLIIQKIIKISVLKFNIF